METTTAWFNLGVNALTMMTLVGGMLGVFWRFVNKQTRAIVLESAVPLSTYKEDQKRLEERLARAEQFDIEFAVLKNQVSHVQQDTTEIKQKVSDLSGEITGAIMRVAKIQGKLEQ